MAGSDDENPPPPPPPQTPTQQAPHTVSTIKLLILKKGEYDIWAMKMEHYLSHTDYPIWEVIQKGNGPVSVSTDTNGVCNVLVDPSGIPLALDLEVLQGWYREYDLAHLKLIFEFSIYKVWKSVEYGVSKELDTVYWGFLGVGTTFDIFQNIILISYLEYGVLSPLDTAYWSLNFCGLLVSEGTDTPYLLDGYGVLVFRIVIFKISSFKLQNVDFLEVRTVHDIFYPTCRAACEALGLLGDDNEWDIAMQETKYRKEMSHDIPQRVLEMTHIPNYHLNDDSLQGYILYELEIILTNCGMSLQHFGLGPPPPGLLDMLANRLLMEERNYKQEELQQEKNESIPKPGVSADERNLISSFASWLLDIGDGRTDDEQGLSKLIDFIYDQMTLITPSAITLQDKAIVCPKNETADMINSKVLEMVQGKTITYLSHDESILLECDGADTEMLYHVEHLNTLKFPGFPPHRLELKIGAPIILLRNVNVAGGLCCVRSVGDLIPFGDPNTKQSKRRKIDIENLKILYNNKAFRVFNTRTRKVEENLHITFLENKTNVAGSGPDWLFNIDLLTNSKNYEPVTVGNQTNKNAGIKDNTQKYIMLYLLYDCPKSSEDAVADDAGKKTNEKPANEGERSGQEKEGGASNKEDD
ncbi:DNA helicase [Tanacetum coccineum]